MTTTTIEARPPSRLLTLAEPGRAFGELASFYALRPLLSSLPRGDGHGVLVLPGFMASDYSTAPLRSLLSDLGYDAAGWNLGRNVRVDNARIEAMMDCVEELHERTQGKISIVGWSLPRKVRAAMAPGAGGPEAWERNGSQTERLAIPFLFVPQFYL